MNAAPANEVNQLNPQRPFKSILRAAPLPTPEKLAIAARLLRGELLRDLASRLGVTPQHLSRAINATGNQGAAVRQRVVDLLGLDLEDIAALPPAEHDPSLAQPSTSGNWNSGAEI